MRETLALNGLTNHKSSFKFSITFETCLSDHRHLLQSMLKTTFQKEELTMLTQRDFKEFTYTNFHSELAGKLNSRTALLRKVSLKL